MNDWERLGKGKDKIREERAMLEKKNREHIKKWRQDLSKMTEVRYCRT